MKKHILLIVMVLLVGMVFVTCSKHDTIYFTDLPDAAQTFLQKYFPDNVVTSAEEHKSEPRFVVMLDNGYEIYFYGDGRWQEIDSQNAILPSEVVKGVLPQTILDYLAAEHANEGVSAIERSSAGYNIKLSTVPALELYFDPTGNVLIDWNE